MSSCSQVVAELHILFVNSYGFNKTRENTHAAIIKLSLATVFFCTLTLKGGQLYHQSITYLLSNLSKREMGHKGGHW